MVMTENLAERIYNPEGNNFSRVAEKIRNGKLSYDVAWKEIQPLLANYIPEYPEKYIAYDILLRKIFDIRREAFLSPEKRDNASNDVRSLLSRVSLSEQDLLIAPVVCIRDLFNIEGPNRKPRSSR